MGANKQLGTSELGGRCAELDREAEAMQRAWGEAKNNSPHFGPNRHRLPGPLGAAPHLHGNLPGDQGFDPLTLWARADDKQKVWLQEAELLHARCAPLQRFHRILRVTQKI